MRILHLVLFSLYIDDSFYQERVLSLQNKKDGHDVVVIASTYNLVNGIPTFSKPSTYYTKEGIKVIRVPYIKIINLKISEKIRAYHGVYKLIEEYKPDIIFSHGIGGYESKTIGKYIRDYPETKLYIDCHTDYLNSAKNFFSKHILHKLFYRHYFWEYVKYAEKVYYLSPDSLPFLKELYGFSDKNKLEYTPVGGYILDAKERYEIRTKTRKELNLSEDSIVLIHSGKLDKDKKSFELLKAFTQVKSDKLRLLIVGKFTDDVYLTIKNFIETDKRIMYLGWKPAEELQNYLIAGDIYMQPGSRTVTVQNAACCGCALILHRTWVYTYLFGEAALYAETENEIKNVLEELIANPSLIANFRKLALAIAEEKLDYQKLANVYIK